jgi:ferritin-like metal-binding protein YciE
MLELRGVQDIPHSQNMNIKSLEANAGTGKVTKGNKVVNDSASMEIRRPVNELPDAGNDDLQSIEKLLLMGQAMRESIIKFRERMAELKRQADEIANSRFSAGNLARNYKKQIEEVLKYSNDTTHPVYSDASEKLVKLRKEIKAILSYDGFLLGVHDNIEEITEQTEFTLEQIPEVLDNIRERHKSLELDRFSLTRIHEEALKALRCQANASGERALKLLENPS